MQHPQINDYGHPQMETPSKFMQHHERIPSKMENRSHDFMPCLIPKGRSHVVPVQAVKEHRLRANESEIPIPHGEVQTGAIIRPFLGGGNSNIFYFHPKNWGR